MELLNEPIYERLYCQSKNNRNSINHIFSSPQKANLLTITGENQNKIEFQKKKEQKLVEKKIHEEKRKEAMEFLTKIKKEKEKIEKKKHKIIRFKEK